MRVNQRPADCDSPSDSPAAGRGVDLRLSTDANSNSDSDSGALAARLKAIIGNESVSAFARKCGVAESVLRTYLRDGRMPPLDKALVIAATAGVSVDWLASGRGVRAAAQVPAAYAVNREGVAVAERPLLDGAVLEGIIKAVVQGQGAQATPEHLAAMIVDLYQRAIDRGER